MRYIPSYLYKYCSIRRR